MGGGTAVALLGSHTLGNNDRLFISGETNPLSSSDPTDLFHVNVILQFIFSAQISTSSTDKDALLSMSLCYCYTLQSDLTLSPKFTDFCCS